VLGAVSLLPLFLCVMSAIVPGGGSPFMWGAFACGGLIVASAGWLLSAVLRVGIALVNAARQRP